MTEPFCSDSVSNALLPMPASVLDLLSVSPLFVYLCGALLSFMVVTSHMQLYDIKYSVEIDS